MAFTKQILHVCARVCLPHAYTPLARST